jgi:hypothetical protein
MIYGYLSIRICAPKLKCVVDKRLVFVELCYVLHFQHILYFLFFTTQSSGAMHVGGGARQDAQSAIKGRVTGRCWWFGAVAQQQELPSRRAAGVAERSGKHAGLVEVDRRWLLSSVLSGASAAAAATLSPPQSASAVDLTPYQRGFQLEYGLTQEGRIRGCPSDVNPNCVSSSSLNATFAPAWTSPMHTDPEAAAQVRRVDGCKSWIAIPNINVQGMKLSNFCFLLLPPLNPIGHCCVQAFNAALLDLHPEAEEVAAERTPEGGVYLRYRVKDPVFDHDDIE